MTILKDHTLNKPDNQKWLKAIGLFQIIGGSCGLILILIAAVGLSKSPSIGILAIAIVLFGLSVYSGLQAFKLADNCLKWTTINQALQIFSFIAGTYSYQYISGVSLEIFIDFSSDIIFGFDFNVSAFHLSLGNTQNYHVSINLIAVYIIYKIEKIKADITTKKELQKSLQKYNA